MLSAGAYSKKFQRLEKEHMRQLEESSQLAIRSAREKAIALSKQTAQRQRAMEERKKAALEAEEQRRKKALEERRKAQLDATERFKVVVGKLKSVPRKPRGVEYCQSNKAIKEATLVQKNPSTRPAPPERVTLGSEVEVLLQRQGSHHRVSSLDDILRSVSRHDPIQNSGSNVNITDYDGGVTRQLKAPLPTGRTVQNKSASDSNLTSHVRQDPAVSLQNDVTPLQAFSPLLEEEEKAPLAEECTLVTTNPLLQRPTKEVRVFSPDPDDDCSSSGDSPSTHSLLQDSLEITRALCAPSKEQPPTPGVKLNPPAVLPPPPVVHPPPLSAPRTSDGVVNHNLVQLRSPAHPSPGVELKCSYHNAVPCFVVDVADDDGSDSSSAASLCPPTKVASTAPSTASTTAPSIAPSRQDSETTPVQTVPSKAAGVLQATTPAPPPPKLVGILKKPVAKPQPALPVEQSTRGSSANVKKVRFSDQDTLDNCTQLFSMPLRVSSQGHINTRVLNGTMSPLPPSYMFAPKVRLLLNHMPGLNKSSTGLVASSTQGTPHVAENGEAEPFKGESFAKNETLDSARPDMGKTTEHKLLATPKVAEENKVFENQTLANASTVERPVAAAVPSQVDRSPTDDDISRVWTQIRSYVQDRHRTTGCVTLPEQSATRGGAPYVMGGAPYVMGGAPYVMGGEGPEPRTNSVLQSREPELNRRTPGAPKQLTQRPSNRPLRVETVSVRDWKARSTSKVLAGLGDPQFSITGGAVLGAHNTLSFEEHKVMQSLEKLNQRLVEHSATTVFSTLAASDTSRPPQPELRGGPYTSQNMRTKSQGAQKVKAGRLAYPDYTNVASVRYK